MIDDENFLRSSRRFRLSADVMALMLKGAAYAALFCTALLFIGMVLLAISRSLPEQSKENADPTPDLSMLGSAEPPTLA